MLDSNDMAFKIVRRALPFTKQTEWLLPIEDNKLQVEFDYVGDIEKIMPFVTNRLTCVQAGGNVGLWPKRFAQLFAAVYSFEPHPSNFPCLVHNAPEKNIIRFQAAVGQRNGSVQMQCENHEVDNLGAYYVQPGGNLPQIRIDDLSITDVGLIQLDIEGAELDALKGAVETIGRFRPTIVVEDKELPQLSKFNRVVGEPERWLAKNFGYKKVARIGRDDVCVST